MAEREQIDMKPDLFITQQVNMVETKRQLSCNLMIRPVLLDQDQSRCGDIL